MDKTTKFLRDIDLSKDEYVVLGFSGGPDSMCLLDLFYKNGYRVICAHVDHNMRPESHDEADFLEDYCSSRGIIFERLILERGDHNEAYYREKRYTFFKKIADRYGTKYIATAHHGDDLVETVLMRIARGSNLKGYMGFPKIYDEGKYRILKPLIFYTKKEIEDYDCKYDLPTLHDSTNDKDSYTRNRYRHEILPFFKKENPCVHTKFLKFSEELEEANLFIQKNVEEILLDMFKDEAIDLTAFSKVDPFLQKKTLEAIFKKIFGDNIGRIKVLHAESILRALKSKTNFEIALPLCYKAVREYDKLSFVKNDAPTTAYEIQFEDSADLPDGSRIYSTEECGDTTNFTTRLNSKDIKFPLYIRNRKNGDFMEIKNLRGAKKIKAIFIDEKVPKSKRDTWPIVTDATGTIVWLPGLKKSKLDIPFKGKYDIILRYEKKGNFDEKK